MSPRVFLLSPATCRGPRAALLAASASRLPLAVRLHSAAGAPLGDVFSFLSGLYFRGKLTYARRFATRATGPGVLVITPDRGLVAPDTPLTPAALRAAGRVDIRADNPRYRRPLEATAAALAATLDAGTEVVLLGSVATGKYVDVLDAVFGARLTFPLAFVGRGDMSRGGLLLRCAAEGRELTYVPVHATPLHGPRPPRLPRPPREAAAPATDTPVPAAPSRTRRSLAGA